MVYGYLASYCIYPEKRAQLFIPTRACITGGDTICHGSYLASIYVHCSYWLPDVKPTHGHLRQRSGRVLQCWIFGDIINNYGDDTRGRKFCRGPSIINDSDAEIIPRARTLMIKKEVPRVFINGFLDTNLSTTAFYSEYFILLNFEIQNLTNIRIPC